MATKEKTYTFRAPEDLAPRARDAFAVWQRMLDPAGDVPTHALDEVMNAFTLAVARRAKAFDDFDNQSALIRAMSELFVEATEKVAADLELRDAYAEWAAQDEEGPAIREGALKAAAERWRDE